VPKLQSLSYNKTEKGVEKQVSSCRHYLQSVQTGIVITYVILSL
jgi:hypothetical protein